LIKDQKKSGGRLDARGAACRWLENAGALEKLRLADQQYDKKSKEVKAPSRRG
jgi:hypothetical protein